LAFAYHNMWIYLGLCSACLLGFYDVCKKHAVRDNAVLPTLLISTAACAAVTLPFLLLSLAWPEGLAGTVFAVTPLSPRAHLLVALKAFLVAGSWMLVYFAMKHLPVTVVSPVRASAPVWTALGAVLLLGERPGVWQWLGLALTLVGFFALALSGRKEGIQFHRNRWVFFLFGGTLLGAASALYDKVLIHNLAFKPMSLQAWFTLYLTAVIGVTVAVAWWPGRRNTTPFRWRWSMPLVGVLLAVADFLYYCALDEGALISLLSPLRRSGVIVAFIAGGLLFREKNKRWKALGLAAILAGVLVLLLKH
jgi:bacterial/archaeal transporter family protein